MPSSQVSWLHSSCTPTWFWFGMQSIDLYGCEAKVALWDGWDDEEALRATQYNVRVPELYMQLSSYMNLSKCMSLGLRFPTYEIRVLAAALYWAVLGDEFNYVDKS